MKILGIETSCDETAVAILQIENGKIKLLSNIVSSQIKIHAQYGGIVPEVAARKQLEAIIPVISEAEKQAGLKSEKVDYLAVTKGPGLVTSLTVGVETAKALAYGLNKKLVAVNHLSGHLLANLIYNKKISYPALGLIVSGGHTLLVLMKNESNYQTIGSTVDDAVGEAFDKVAKILNLGYPGGPIISKLATEGNEKAFDLPRPMISQQNLDFSFSGLKTAVLYLTQDKKFKRTQKNTRDLCASFEQACIDVLISKTFRAIKKYKPKSLITGGGVIANKKLRETLVEKMGQKYPEVKIFIPELRFSGDNATMIASAAYPLIKAKKFTDPFKLKADPNLEL